MTSLREQEIKEARSKIKRIEEKMGSRKRYKEQLKGAGRKRLKYNVEEESWGKEQGATEVGSSTPPPPLKPTEEQGGGEQLILQPPPPPPQNLESSGSSLGTTMPNGSSAEPRSRLEVEPLCIQKSILEYFEPEPPEPAGIPQVDQRQPPSQLEDEYFASCNDRNQGDKSEGNTEEHTSNNEEQHEVMFKPQRHL